MLGLRRVGRRAPPGLTAVAAGILLVLVVGAVLRDRWQRRTMGAAARAWAMPGCVARLGDEATCQDHFAAYHDDCARLNYRTGKGVTPGITEPRYLDCIVLGVDDWIADNKSKREAADRERARESTLPGH
jgi:hypothetical protein